MVVAVMVAGALCEVAEVKTRVDPLHEELMC